MPYQAMQTLLDPLWPKGIHAYFKATNLARLDDELIDTLSDLSLAAPGPQAEIHVQQMGGAVARVADDATAFPERGMPFVLNVVTGWQDDSVGDAHRDWARETVRAASASSTGRAYVNFLGDRDGARAAYGEEKYVRLASLKRAFDPTNVFRLNHNIQPEGEAA
jgi:berberine-like enzyme